MKKYILPDEKNDKLMRLLVTIILLDIFIAFATIASIIQRSYGIEERVEQITTKLIKTNNINN